MSVPALLLFVAMVLLLISLGASPASSREPAPQASCLPSYPNFCIRPPPPDLDCPDIARKRFRVLPPDPHRFDRDEDVIGCER